MIQCQYCKSDFGNKSSLNSHQKRAKYCLIKQGKFNNEKKSEDFKCGLCNKNLSTKQTLDIHKNICSKKIQKEDEFKCEYCDKFLSTKHILNSHIIICDKKKDHEISTLKSEISALKNEISALKVDIINKDNSIKNEIINKNLIIVQFEKTEINYQEQIKELQDKLERMLSKAIDKPTHTTNTTNTVNNTLNTFMKQEDVNYKISSKFNDLYLFEGLKGVAQFIFDHILKDEDGNLLYGCPDFARKKFEYKDQYGNIVIDIEGKKLIKIIQPGLIDQTNKMIYFFTDEYNDIKNSKDDYSLMSEKDVKLFRKKTAIKVGMDIATMHENNTFIKELSKIIK